MNDKKIYSSIGLMSGTSLDGVDISLIKTDGYRVFEIIPAGSKEYSDELKKSLRGILNKQGDLFIIERDLTIFHANVVNEFLETNNLTARDIDLIGFPGHTISHRPHDRITTRLDDASLLAELTGINVIADFRRRDMAAGGNGAPLVPLYHQAIMKNFDIAKPLIIVNIGGVANITWLGDNDDEILAFDTGPGNALINDLIYKKTGKDFDDQGNIARMGKIRQEILNTQLANPYFNIKPPKSLDRNHFNINLEYLSLEDASATLTAFTAHSIALAQKFVPKEPTRWLICGGGAHNKFLMEELTRILQQPVEKIQNYNIYSDSFEAQAFAFLAVRSYLGLHLSVPSTTGVIRPVTGGAFYRA